MVYRKNIMALNLKEYTSYKYVNTYVAHEKFYEFLFKFIAR